MNIWSREETIVAFYVYCKIPFKDCNKTHPIIKEYAQILKRSPSALSMKVGNIGRLDPDLQKNGISGLVHGAHMEERVWKEFSGDPERLSFERAKIIANLLGKSVEEGNVEPKLIESLQGNERERIVKQRINQNFFRMTVLSSYNYRCCISGISNLELLEACHIVDWSKDVVNRTNPSNGLCLNPFFHKAYDKLLMAISPDFKIIFSDELLMNVRDDKFQKYLSELQNEKICLPDRFIPKKEFLQVRYEQFKHR